MLRLVSRFFLSNDRITELKTRKIRSRGPVIRRNR
jgi:hypothetical protein